MNIPSSAEPKAPANRTRLPVTVLMERYTARSGRWSQPAWRLNGVLSGEALPRVEKNGARTRETAQGGEHLWGGLHITLYRDACERYWHALIGDEPKVYVVCREDVAAGPGALEPMLVTIDYDEAVSFLENDQPVVSGPIPGDLYRLMESFVLAHYRPSLLKKRKRQAWSDEGRPRTQGLAQGLAQGRDQREDRSAGRGEGRGV